MKYMLVLMAFLLLAITTRPAAGQELMMFSESLEVRDLTSRVSTLAEEAFSGLWVLAVVDPSLAASQDLLFDLMETEVNMSRLKVLVLSDDSAILQRFADGLPAGHWLLANEVDAFDQLGLPGTPILFGFTGRRIVWQRAGTVSEQQLLKLSDWMTRANGRAAN